MVFHEKNATSKSRVLKSMHFFEKEPIISSTFGICFEGGKSENRLFNTCVMCNTQVLCHFLFGEG